jgi:hypothetical protein
MTAMGSGFPIDSEEAGPQMPLGGTTVINACTDLRRITTGGWQP